MAYPPLELSGGDRVEGDKDRPGPATLYPGKSKLRNFKHGGWSAEWDPGTPKGW